MGPAPVPGCGARPTFEAQAFARSCSCCVGRAARGVLVRGTLAPRLAPAFRSACSARRGWGGADWRVLRGIGGGEAQGPGWGGSAPRPDGGEGPREGCAGFWGWTRRRGTQPLRLLTSPSPPLQWVPIIFNWLSGLKLIHRLSGPLIQPSSSELLPRLDKVPGGRGRGRGLEGPLKRWPEPTEEVGTRAVTDARGPLGRSPGAQLGGGPSRVE